ncbi:MAG: helix-turn-helix transcriptional regulator [Erysipelotrichales bacterium]|nr:helix-turn-helix transcriptional regulator [Erysipelotrichales bacterium]
MTFGERLIELRKQKNLSQEQLAEIMDVSRQSISKWETDKAYPEMNRLVFMSDYFGVSLDYLMRGEEEKMKSTTYQAENMMVVWNTFVSNLNDKQKRMFIFMYGLVALVLVLLAVFLTYSLGYALGKFIYHLAH